MKQMYLIGSIVDRKHIKNFTNVIITLDRVVSIKYDDDFDWHWYTKEEMLREPEVQNMIQNGYAEVI